MLAALSPAMTFLWWVYSARIFAGRIPFFENYQVEKDLILVLELPPMRLPKLSNIGVKTLARIEWYLREAVPLFF
jgi:Fe2+ transport system protein B